MTKDERIAELEEALRPFAIAADVPVCGEWRDDQNLGQNGVAFYITFGDLRNARSALKQEIQVAEIELRHWRDIETAPKDGSNILIIAGTAYSPEARQGWWDGEWWAFYSRPEKFVVPGPTRMIEVTHWMPLPEPPRQALSDTSGSAVNG